MSASLSVACGVYAQRRVVLIHINNNRRRSKSPAATFSTTSPTFTVTDWTSAVKSPIRRRHRKTVTVRAISSRSRSSSSKSGAGATFSNDTDPSPFMTNLSPSGRHRTIGRVSERITVRRLRRVILANVSRKLSFSSTSAITTDAAAKAGATFGGVGASSEAWPPIFAWRSQ